MPRKLRDGKRLTRRRLRASKLAAHPGERVASRAMTALLPIVIGGVVLAVAGVALFMRATRQKPAPVDPIASTTGIQPNAHRYQRHR